MPKEYVRKLEEAILGSEQRGFRQLEVDGVTVLRDDACQTIGCYLGEGNAIELPQQYRTWMPRREGETIVFKNPLAPEIVYFAQNGDGILPIELSFTGRKGIQPGDSIDDYLSRAVSRAISKRPERRAHKDLVKIFREIAQRHGFKAR
jgi:hypothetical protein